MPGAGHSSAMPPRLPRLSSHAPPTLRRRAWPSLALAGAMLAALSFAGGMFVAGQATEAARPRPASMTVIERQVESMRLWRGAGALAALGLLLAGLAGRTAGSPRSAERAEPTTTPTSAADAPPPATGQSPAPARVARPTEGRGAVILPLRPGVRRPPGHRPLDRRDEPVPTRETETADAD